jgi:ribosome maturation factor RimP
MINKQLIQKMAEDFLRDTDNYLIEVKVSAANKILVHIGNDQHVAIGDCVALSRKIEHSLDREAEDFELEVGSPGIDQPFKVLRQYQKYLGKDVEIKTSNGLKYSGVLTSATDQEVTLLPKFKKSNKKSSGGASTFSTPFEASYELLGSGFIFSEFFAAGFIAGWSTPLTTGRVCHADCIVQIS